MAKNKAKTTTKSSKESSKKKTPKKTSESEGRTVVTLQGWLVQSRLPSRHLLQKVLPLKAETGKGKSKKSVRIGNREVHLVSKYFKNKIGNLSRHWYLALATMTVKLGWGLYILPYDRLDDYRELVEYMQSEYEEYEEDLKDFLRSGEFPKHLLEKNKLIQYDVKDYLRIVQGYLGKDSTGIENISIASKFESHLVPFHLDWDAIEQHIDDTASKAAKKEFQTTKAMMTKAFEADFEKKANDWLSQQKAELERAAKKMRQDDLTKAQAKRIAAGIENLNSLALTPKAQRVVKRVAKVFDNPKKFFAAPKAGRASALAKRAAKTAEGK
tara:strand:+ start:14 stop:994 length:981 start_codon:yes stop_codon:yes gene_type:complete